MSYRAVSLLLYRLDLDRSMLDAAMSMAARWNAKLDVTCIGICHAAHEIVPLGAAATLIEGDMQEAEKTAHALMAQVQALLPSVATNITIKSKVIHSHALVGSIAALTKYADLVLLRPPYAENGCDLDIAAFEAAIFGSGAPVLIVPEAFSGSSKLDRILIGWNESTEALNAVRQAMPLLQDAKDVEIVAIDPPGNSAERSDPGGNLSSMLLEHGVRANVAVISCKAGRVSDTLIDHAQRFGAELIIMGAYGHSRLREAVFGGATRDMLGKATTAVLMAR